MTREEARAALVDLCGELAAEQRRRGFSCLWQVTRFGERLSTHLTEGAARRWIEDTGQDGRAIVVPLDAAVENQELERALKALCSFAEGS